MSVHSDNNKQMLFDLLKSIGLDNNMKINVAFAKFAPIGVDTKEDLDAVKKIMENKS